MWDFLKSDVSVAALVVLFLVVAVALIHSLRTRRALRSVIEHRYAEISADAMMSEILRNQEKYRELNREELEQAGDSQLIEMFSYHLAALAEGQEKDSRQVILETQGEKGIVFSVLFTRRQILSGRFFDLFLYENTDSFLQKAIYSYKAVGAPRSAKVLVKVRESVKSKYEKKGLDALFRGNFLVAAEDDFKMMDRWENVRKLCAAYIKKNLDAICD